MEDGQIQMKEKSVLDTEYRNWGGTGSTGHGRGAETGKPSKGQLLQAFVSHGNYFKVYSKGN